MGRNSRRIAERVTAFKNSRWPRLIAFGWLAVVALYFLWEAIAYRGFTAYCAEWEYTRLGEHYPVITLALLVGLVGAPALWVLSRVRRRKRREMRRRGDDERLFAAETEHALLRVLFVCANAALLLAVVALIWTQFLPDADGPARPVSVADGAMPGEGHVTLIGKPVYRRIATYDQSTLILRNVIQFAPMASGDDTIRYFVEITPDRLTDLRRRADAQPYTGILQKNALPGPILRLFRYAGYRIDRPHFVLYASRASLRWPYYVMAFNCFVAACLLAALGLFQRRRLRQTREHAVVQIA